MRTLFPCSLVFLCLQALPSIAHAETGRTTPGLRLETGARTAYCDQLMFTPDGNHVLAVGEDKVIRRWAVGPNGVIDPRPHNIRWPILRESRGSIFAAAFDRTGKRLAIGGFGVKTGLVAAIPLDATGKISVTDPVPDSGQVNWAICFSPDDRYVVYGNETGEIYRWEPGVTSTAKPRPFAGSEEKGKSPNRVRAIGFLDANHFFSVAMDCKVRVWDVRSPTTGPKVLKTEFSGPKIFRAVYHKGRGLLAVSSVGQVDHGGEVSGAAAAGTIEILDLKADRMMDTLKVPQPRDGYRTVRALAFDRDGTHLAAGCQELPKLDDEGDFYRINRGVVMIADIGTKGGTWAEKGLPTGYAPDALAYHPIKPHYLATAGGNNHEVRVWDAARGELADGMPEAASGSVLRGPANCVWAVAFDRKGKYFAWKEKRLPTPKHPNDLATGDWRVFDLGGRGGRQILAAPPADFDPVKPINSVDGWEVKPVKGTTSYWRVTGPGGISVELKGGNGDIYNQVYNQEPRCWTFVKAAGKPLRLAIGHQWGVSVYDCTARGVKLFRVMTGHEGQVMCIAPSADGLLVLTGSRDQTVCAWSLGEWTTGNEMGASFAVKGGKLEVTAVDEGSPAWEPANPVDGTDREVNRLAVGDVIDLLLIKNESFAHRDDPADYEALFPKEPGHKTVVRDPARALAYLRAIKPAQEYFFGKRAKVKVDGKEVLQTVYKLTTCRQRPLWRFFATRSDNPAGGREWVIWRPRDYLYDTSATGDQYVGWHVNSPDLTETPAFYPLERFHGSDHVPGAAKGAPSGFHRPDKIWPFVMRAFQQPEKVIFTEIEPPRVNLKVVEVPEGARAAGRPEVTKQLVIEVTITSVDTGAVDQFFRHMDVFLNEYKLTVTDPTEKDRSKAEKPLLKPSVSGRFKPTTITITPDQLILGQNVIRVSCENRKGGRGQQSVMIEYVPKEARVANLHAIIVGIADYRKAKGDGEGIGNLQCSETDAKAIESVLKQHKESRNFKDVFVTRIPQDEATARNILARIDSVAAKVKPDDWLLVFLAGHGAAEVVKGEDKKEYAKPGTFYFVTADCDLKDEKTLLTSKKLYDSLMRVKGRKMLVLDACHSGALVKDAAILSSDPLRDLTRDGKSLFVLSSCQGTEKALEPSEPGGKFKHGFFTHALLNVIGDEAVGKAKTRVVPVTYGELQDRLKVELQTLLKEIKAEKEKWHEPALSPSDPRGLSVLARPLTGGGGK